MPDLSDLARPDDIPTNTPEAEGVVTMTIPDLGTTQGQGVATTFIGTCMRCGKPYTTEEELREHMLVAHPETLPKIDEKQEQQAIADVTEKIEDTQERQERPQRNEKGQFIKGNTESHGVDSGRPCGFCENQERYLAITREYIEKCQKSEKPMYASLADLAIKLGIYLQRMSEWSEKKKKNTDELEHPEFQELIKTIKTMQFGYLEKRLLGRFNPTGSIFLMKTQHGQIETEKQIHAGDKDNPVTLEVEIIEDKRDDDND